MILTGSPDRPVGYVSAEELTALRLLKADVERIRLELDKALVLFEERTKDATSPAG